MVKTIFDYVSRFRLAFVFVVTGDIPKTKTGSVKKRNLEKNESSAVKSPRPRENRMMKQRDMLMEVCDRMSTGGSDTALLEFKKEQAEMERVERAKEAENRKAKEQADREERLAKEALDRADRIAKEEADRKERDAERAAKLKSEELRNQEQMRMINMVATGNTETMKLVLALLASKNN